MNDDKMLLSGAHDLFALCEKRGCPVFSCFYDAAQQTVLKRSGMLSYTAGFWGGHKACERKILGVFPEWEEIEYSKFPIRAVKISHTYPKELSHRDYLGSIMGLGIERNRIGDIFVYENYAVCFASDSLGEYLMQRLDKIGSVGVKLSDVTKEIFDAPERKTRKISAVCASNRLDAVLSAVTGESRAKAAGLINHEKVSVNHEIISDNSKKVAEGDLLSVKGCGRFLINSFGGKTRSDRIHIEAEKFL